MNTQRSHIEWLELITGILLILLGILTIISPGRALNSLVFVYGLLALISGISDIVFYVKTEKYTGFGPTISLIAGIMSIVAGAMLLAYPDASRYVMAVLIPVWFLAHSISHLSHLNRVRFLAGDGYYYFSLIVNILGLVLGMLILVRPIFSLLSMGWLIGIYLILLGVDSLLIAVGIGIGGRR